MTDCNAVMKFLDSSEVTGFVFLRIQPSLGEVYSLSHTRRRTLTGFYVL